MQTSSAHIADTEYLVRQASSAGYQWSSLLAPPAYIAYITARRGRGALSLSKVLRATWVGGFSGILAWRHASRSGDITNWSSVTGAAATGGAAYVRYAYSSEESVRMRRIRTAYDVSHIISLSMRRINGIFFPSPDQYP
jgi:hypothetical protein